MASAATDSEAHINHLGIIIDGNRRWARKRGLPTLKGHQQGYKRLMEIVRYGFKRGIDNISVFVFSTENWQRSKDEVNYLMRLVYKMAVKDIDKLNEDNIKVKVLGSKERLSKKVIQAWHQAEEQTKRNTGGTLGVCFNYGGRQEIIDAANKAAKASNKVVNESDFAQYLYAPELPDLDLVVRTSGEMRLSNFMLWRAAYAELIFVNKLWPDFSKQDLDKVISVYNQRNRRFGK